MDMNSCRGVYHAKTNMNQSVRGETMTTFKKNLPLSVIVTLVQNIKPQSFVIRLF